MSNSAFTHDVFLSHSAGDKPVIRPMAERLRADGLRVWFDEWEIQSGDSIPEKIEEGLQHSRVLVLCISRNAVGPDWTIMEGQTFRFRDPLNKERRFIPVRLDDAPVNEALAGFDHIRWNSVAREREYSKLLDACKQRSEALHYELAAYDQVSHRAVQLENTGRIYAYAFNPDATRALSAGADHTVRLWDLTSGVCLRVFNGHKGEVNGVAWSTDQLRALSAADDRVVRLWDVATGESLRQFRGHGSIVWSVAWSPDQRYAVSGDQQGNILLWDVNDGRRLREFEGHGLMVRSLWWSADQRLILSAADDTTLRLWDVETGRCVRILTGHTGSAYTLAWSSDSRLALSGSHDKTLRLWDIHTGLCLRVLEGHPHFVHYVAWSADQRWALSGAADNCVRLWDVDQGGSSTLGQHSHEVRTVSWITGQRKAVSGDEAGEIRLWDLAKLDRGTRDSEDASRIPFTERGPVQYTNAKVLLVGESGAGKTGLSRVLAGEKWEPSDSTVGAWSTQWKLPILSEDGIEREIWLWDFGGQADQRLIHQLYLDETALAVLVFDGQKDDVFETIGQWDRDLTRASVKSFTKLLVAGRVDAGGLRVSRSQLEAFAKERGFTEPLLETSAKLGTNCEELRQAIIRGIRWDEIPWRSSPALFKRLKDEIVRLKDAGRVIVRFNELRETLHIRMSGDGGGFTDEELKAVVGLLAGPGVVWELKFGSWVLLQPERINAYAQAVIQTMRADAYERGCLPEERVLNGDLTYQSSMARLGSEEERFVLLAMHQTLVERGLCLREHTDSGPLLIFPSFYRRERPELVGHPAVLVSYRFNGFLDDIYATLIVRLHHTNSFQADQLWRYAADFRTLTGKHLGVKLHRRAEGAGELELYFDPMIEAGEKIIFSKYVHEHLLRTANEVVRLRHYVCLNCSTPVGNREVAMRRLEEGKRDILCVSCEQRVPLWDELEELFASPEMKQVVRDLHKESEIVLDSESKERALVGEVISTVALAGQISREFSVSDHGIDMEIEFKSDDGEATGRKLYLQLKSGDSYLRERKSDGAEVFTIRDERHARYWAVQAFPVLLVVRNSDGEVRWMEVREYLRRESYGGKKAVKQIIYQGERFDVMSVRHWRDAVLRGSSAGGLTQP